MDLGELVLVQERFGRAIDHTAVVEHETGAVRVPEELEVGDLNLAPRLPVVQVIDDVVAVFEPDEVEMKLVAH